MEAKLMIDLVDRLTKVRDDFKSDMDRMKEGHLSTRADDNDHTKESICSYEARIAELDSIISTLESAASGPNDEG
jgi:hypothetical protein